MLLPLLRCGTVHYHVVDRPNDCWFALQASLRTPPPFLAAGNPLPTGALKSSVTPPKGPLCGVSVQLRVVNQVHCSEGHTCEAVQHCGAMQLQTQPQQGRLNTAALAHRDSAQAMRQRQP